MGSILRGAIHRPVTVSMFILAVSLFGYISLDRLALNDATQRRRGVLFASRNKVARFHFSDA